MEYLGPSKCRTLEVTDSLKLSNVDVGAAITNLQSGFGNLTTADVTLKNVTCTSLTSSGTVSCGVSPTALGHLTPKAYVDGISYLQAGAGLSKNFSSLSVNAAQPGITSVGTLTSLTTGAITGTSATFSSAISVGTPTATGHATNKSYVDGIGYITAGAGLTKTSGTLSVNPTQTQITSVGTLGSLNVSGDSTMAQAITSKIKAYGGLNQIIVGNSAVAGGESSIAFLANTNGTFGTGVQTGWAVGNGVGSMGQGNFSIYGTGLPGNAFSIQYADNSIKHHSSTDSTSPTTGGTQILGGLGVAKNVNVGGTLNVTGNAGFSSSLLSIAGGTTEAYTLNSSSKGLYIPAGTVFTLASGYNSVDGATLMYISTNNASNGSCGVFVGAVGGISNGAGNFVIGRRTGATSWAESLRVDTNGTLVLSSGLSATSGTFSSTTRLATNSNVLTSSSGSLNVNGDIHLYNGTTPSTVTFATAAFGPPTTTNRSIGSRLVVYPGVSATTADWAIGIEQNNLWFSTSSATTGFSWYGGATLAASLSGAGSLALTGGISATTGSFTGAVSTSAVPSSANHLTNKNYVDNAITTNAQVSTGTFTTGTFSISGLTFVGLTKSVRWSKIGAAVIVSSEMSWTSTTGTLVEADGNTTISTPFNSPVVRSMLATIQKDSFVTTRMSYMDEASPALRTRVNAADMPGYATGATLLFSWIFYT